MKNKYTKTELPITIITDDEHREGDNLELTRQRIERAAMYLMSIFNLLKVSALHFEGQSESKEMSGAFEDFINHSAIGYGIADSILAAASCLTEFQPDEIKTEFVPAAALAAQISSLLSNPDLPDDFYNSVIEGMDKLADASGNKTLSKFEKSAGYIESVLTDYAESQTEARNE